MQRIRLVIIFVSCVFLSACIDRENIIEIASPKISFSPASSPAVEGTPQETTPVPTSATHTSTTIPSTDIPLAQEKTVYIEGNIPTEIGWKGMLVGIDRQNEQHVLLVLPQLITYPLPGNQPSLGKFPHFAISPDRTKLAYMDITQEGDKDLRVVNGDGVEQTVLNWSGEFWWMVIGWHDEQRIALAEIDHRDGTTFVYDSALGKMTELTPFFPEVNSNGPLLPAGVMPVPFVYYDPSLTRLLIARYGVNTPSQTNYELWDVPKQVVLWEGSSYKDSDDRPVWSPDKLNFVVSVVQSSSPEEEKIFCESLLLISRNGEQRFLDDCTWGPYSFSPDGRSITTWRANHGEPCGQYETATDLLVIDLKMGQKHIYTLCPGDSEGGIRLDQYPLWSPSGRFIAFNTYDVRLTSVNAIVLDLDQDRAFILPGIEEVLGWMKSSP
jgi:hypothetical protein